MEIREIIQREMFSHLDKQLETEIKAKFKENGMEGSLRRVLEHLSDWFVVRGAGYCHKYDNEIAHNFINDLKKL